MRLVCSVEGCGSFVKGRGLCNKHLIRLRKFGDVNAGQTHAPLFDRFWRQVDRRGDDECWPWLGSFHGKGYGRIGEGGRAGRYLLAHRLSCEIHHGPAPSDSSMALHSCDNPVCVNPAHLSWGTGTENTKQAYEKGRKLVIVPCGEKSPRAVLNEEQVKFIRAHPEMRLVDLVLLLNQKVGAIRAVREGRTWKHLL